MDALGEEFERAKVLEAQEFRSGIFLNSSTGKMQFTPLPEEAQWSPSFGVVVEDFNGDGELDLFLAQNFFGTNPEYSRCDSGRGLLLIGTGRQFLKPRMRGKVGFISTGNNERALCRISIKMGEWIWLLVKIRKQPNYI